MLCATERRLAQARSRSSVKCAQWAVVEVCTASGVAEAVWSSVASQCNCPCMRAARRTGPTNGVVYPGRAGARGVAGVVKTERVRQWNQHGTGRTAKREIRARYTHKVKPADHDTAVNSLAAFAIDRQGCHEPSWKLKLAILTRSRGNDTPASSIVYAAAHRPISHAPCRRHCRAALRVQKLPVESLRAESCREHSQRVSKPRIVKLKMEVAQRESPGDTVVVLSNAVRPQHSRMLE